MSFPCCFLDTLPTSTQNEIKKLIDSIMDNQENEAVLEKLLQQNLEIINTYPTLFPSFILPIINKLRKTQV